jgi:hypothetical protein
VLSKNIKIRIYRNIILPVVLYGWENSSLTLREEHRLRMFKNRALRRIFGPKRDEVAGKFISVQAVKFCERLRLPHFQILCSQMAARLSALCAGCFLPPGRFLVLISVRG